MPVAAEQDQIDDASFTTTAGDETSLLLQPATGAITEKKRYVCPECRKRFTRLEHMKRHRQLHTQVPRPFQCSDCPKSFTRRDALYRHCILHKRPADERGAEGGGGEDLIPPRRRAAVFRIEQACLRCSRLKLKCNGEHPCSRCQSQPSGTCQYSRSRSKAVAERCKGGLGGEEEEQEEQESEQESQDTDMMESVSMANEQQEQQQQQQQEQGQSMLITSDNNNTFDPLNYSIDEMSFAQDQGAQQQTTNLMVPCTHPHPHQQERQVMVLDPLLDQVVPARDHHHSIMGQGGSPNDILPNSEFDWLFASQSPHPSSSSSRLDPYQQSLPDAWSWSFFIDSGGIPSSINTALPSRSPPFLATATGATARPSREEILAPLELLSYTALNRAECNELEDDGEIDEIDDDEEQATPTSSSQRTTKTSRTITQMEPRDLRAPSRRNSIPGDGGGTVKDWPNSWYPNAEDMQINAVFFENASEDILLLENTAQVTEFDDDAKVRLLKIVDFAELPDRESDQVYQMLSGVSLATYNIMIQCFFERFQPNNPFIHQSTFHPAKCNGLLLGAICATGTLFSQTPKASNLGNVLIDLVHRAIIMSTTRNNLHARSLSNIQALVLICIYLGNAGNRRFLEHAEACRGAVITMVRRCRLLDSSHVPALVSNNKEFDNETRWKAWLHWEVGRRTGWASFIFDMELSTTWTLSPSFLLNELQTPLPCSVDLWEAPNADLWASLYAQQSLSSSSSPSVSKTHDAFEESRLDKELAKLDTFQTVIASQSLVLLGQSIINLLQSRLARHAVDPLQQAFLAQVNTCIVALSSSRLASSEGGGESSTHRVKWATAEIILHFQILRMFVDLHDLQALGGRRGTEETRAASRRLEFLFTGDFSMAHTVAQHCAQTVRLAIHHHVEIASLSTTLYYSVVYLYSFSRVWSASASSSSSMKGTRIVMEKVGDLASPRAPQKILSTMANYFLHHLVHRAWPTCKNLGAILSDMASHDFAE